MSQASLSSVISWCQDWFYKSPGSLQKQIDALAKRVTALEKGGGPAVDALDAEIRADTSDLADK